MRKKRLFNLPKIQAKRHAKFRWEKLRRQGTKVNFPAKRRKKRKGSMNPSST